MLNEKLMIRALPAPCVIKNFVQGEQYCNYEFYLIDLLNQSTWFRNRTQCLFRYSSKQDAGECDAYANEYGIDFKLFESKSFLQARSIFTHQITKIQDGVTAFSSCKVKKGEIKATWIHVAFRDKCLNDLLTIRSNAKTNLRMEQDIIEILDSLETKKNLVLFYPYVFHTDINLDNDDLIDMTRAALNQDFTCAFTYRTLKAVGFETFFVTICQDSFVIFEERNANLHFVDRILIEKINRFMTLYNYREY